MCTLDALEEHGGDLAPIHHKTSNALGMKRCAHEVLCDARRNDIRIKEGTKKAAGSAIGAQHVPHAVDKDSAVGLLLFEQKVDGPAHRRHGEAVKRGRCVDGGKASAYEHRVSLAQFEIERAREQKHHLAARLCLACFEAAQVTGGDFGFETELFLAPPSNRPVLPEQTRETLVHINDHAPEAVRRAVLAGVCAWFCLDSAGSIASGNASNALFNVFVLALATGPLWVRAGASDATLQTEIR